jgi:malonate transporter
MFDILLKTLPFFALVGLGYGAGRRGIIAPEASAALTKFVFYFALSAMLIKLGSTVPLAELFDAEFAAAYLAGCATVYLLVFAIARARGVPVDASAVEAQCAVIGNTGFLGVPMLVMLLGAAAAPSVLLVLVLDMVVFNLLITLIITGVRAGRLSFTALPPLGLGLLKNPMLVSMTLGLIWGATSQRMPAPLEDFLTLLGAAATPCALFAIGASLAGHSTERFQVAVWLSFAKLILHPLAVAFFAFQVFAVDPFAAAVMVATAALPVAGNTYILAAHFGVAPQRVSASILVSTAVSIVTVTAVIAWVTGV